MRKKDAQGKLGSVVVSRKCRWWRKRGRGAIDRNSKVKEADV
jgi:hypothetical protein